MVGTEKTVTTVFQATRRGGEVELTVCVAQKESVHFTVASKTLAMIVRPVGGSLSPSLMPWLLYFGFFFFLYYFF